MLSCIHLGLLAAQRKVRNSDGEKDLSFSAENFEENYDNHWQQHQQILNDAIQYSNQLDSSDDRCPDGRSNSNSDDDTPSDQSLADDLQHQNVNFQAVKITDLSTDPTTISRIVTFHDADVNDSTIQKHLKATTLLQVIKGPESISKYIVGHLDTSSSSGEEVPRLA